MFVSPIVFTIDIINCLMIIRLTRHTHTTKLCIDHVIKSVTVD